MGATVRVFPNPAKEEFTVDFSLPEAGLVEMNIFSVEGKLSSEIINETMGPGDHQVHFKIPGNLKKGNYLLQIKNDQTTKYKKIVLI